MCCGGGNAAVADLDHYVHHLEIVLELPLSFCDVPRIPVEVFFRAAMSNG